MHHYYAVIDNLYAKVDDNHTMINDNNDVTIGGGSLLSLPAASGYCFLLLLVNHFSFRSSNTMHAKHAAEQATNIHIQ